MPKKNQKKVSTRTPSKKVVKKTPSKKKSTQKKATQSKVARSSSSQKTKKTVTKKKPTAKKTTAKKVTTKKKSPAKKKTTAKKTASKKVTPQKSTSKGVSLKVKRINKKSSLGIGHLDFHPLATESPKKQSFPRKHSHHVIDLKKVRHEKEVEQSKKEDYVGYLKQQTQERLQPHKEKIETFSKSLKKKIESRPVPEKKERNTTPLHYPKTTSIIEVELEGPDLLKQTIQQQTPQKEPKKIEKKRQFTLPSISLPKLKLPKLPEFSLPNINFPSFSFLQFSPLTPYARNAVASFVVASLVLVSPLLAYDTYQSLHQTKGSVLGITHSALNHLNNSRATTQAQDYLSTQHELNQARQGFIEAQQELASINPIIKTIIKALPQDKEFTTAQQLLELGELSTGLAEDIVQILEDTQAKSLSSQLSHLLELLQEKQNDIIVIKELLQSIDHTAIPSEYQDRFQSLSSAIPLIDTYLNSLFENADVLLNIVGQHEEKKYLFVFQNNNEMRATGGFIGSFAELTIDEGEITNMYIPDGGTYDLEAGLTKNILPPKPLQVLNDRWEIQDANYYADFPTSAEKIEWFYQNTRKTSVDGIFAINATFMQSLLSLTGPIYVEEYDAFVSQENFIDIAQYEAELGGDKEANQPKRLISILTPMILERLLTLEDISLAELIATMHTALVTKDIQLYFTDPSLQEFARSHYWSGEQLNTKGDYLNIISTNIAGGKTDTFLDDEVNVDVSIDDNGEIINTVTLTRTHTGEVDNPLSGVKHNDYLRFYVPLGATLISSEGFEPLPDSAYRTADYPVDVDFDVALMESTKVIEPASQTETYQEGTYTVFANWVQTDVGEKEQVSISYKLPFKLESVSPEPNNLIDIIKNEFIPQEEYTTYSLLLQKQSGRINPHYTITITAPPKHSYIWAYPSKMKIDHSTFTLENHTLTKDIFLGLVLDTK